MFEAPLSRRKPPQPRIVLTALLAGCLVFLGLALAVGPVAPGGASGPMLTWLGLVGALLGPALGLTVAERLRGDASLPVPDSAERARLAAGALIVEGAVCEVGAMLCGLAVLLHGPDLRVLVAVLVPLGRLIVLRNRAGEPVAPA